MRWLGWFRKPEPLPSPKPGYSRSSIYARSTIDCLGQNWLELDAFKTLRLKARVMDGVDIQTWTIEYRWDPEPGDVRVLTVTAVHPQA